ncbi:unnamed protein product [Sphagnum balticum]
MTSTGRQNPDASGDIGRTQDDDVSSDAGRTQDSLTKIGRKFNGRTSNERRLQRWQRGRLQHCIAFATTLLQCGCCYSAHVAAALLQRSVVAPAFYCCGAAAATLLQRSVAAALLLQHCSNALLLRRCYCNSRCCNAAALWRCGVAACVVTMLQRYSSCCNNAAAL